MSTEYCRHVVNVSTGRLRRAWGVGALALAGVTALAACGSTVPRNSLAAARARAGSALAGDSESADAQAADEAAATDAGSGGASAGSSAAQSAAANAASSAAHTAAGRTAASGKAGLTPIGPGTHGVTDKTIEVGLWYIDTAAANAIVGAISGNASSFSSSVDWRKGGQAVIDYINSHGGAAGRQLVPVWYHVNEQNAATPSGRAQETQQACAAWTEDHHVFAMHGWVAATSLACAKDTKTVLLSDWTAGGQYSISESTFRQMRDYWFSPNGLVSDRRERDIVEALWNQGYFTKGAKVGVLIEDRPETKEGVAKGMIPALKAHGIDPVQIVYPDGIENNWQNYMFQLFQANVTHVIFSQSDAQGFTVGLAMRAADNQKYYPEWGIASDLQPAGLTNEGAPAAEMAHVHGMGWFPLFDTQTAISDKYLESEPAKTCNKIENEQPGAFGYCEDLFFLKYALDHATEVSPAGISAALGRADFNYTAAWTFGGRTQLAPGYHDGVMAYRDLGYDPNCGQSGNSCVAYTSGLKTLPARSG